MSKDPAPIAETIKPDGRHLRSENNKAKIINACLTLMASGKYHIDPSQVSQMAGLSERTVFRLFHDIESLYQAIYHHLADEIVRKAALPFVHEQWPENLLEVIERRITGCENMMPYRTASEYIHFLNDGGKQATLRILAAARKNLEKSVPEHVPDRANIVEALDSFLSFDNWAKLRTSQGLSFERASEVFRFGAAKLIK